MIVTGKTTPFEKLLVYGSTVYDLKMASVSAKCILWANVFQTDLQRKHHCCMELIFLVTTYDNSGPIWLRRFYNFKQHFISLSRDEIGVAMHSSWKKCDRHLIIPKILNLSIAPSAVQWTPFLGVLLNIIYTLVPTEGAKVLEISYNRFNCLYRVTYQLILRLWPLICLHNTK